MTDVERLWLAGRTPDLLAEIAVRWPEVFERIPAGAAELSPAARERLLEHLGAVGPK